MIVTTTCERERMRQEIEGYSRALMLSGGVSELCATEATPKQEEFLHRSGSVLLKVVEHPPLRCRSGGAAGRACSGSAAVRASKSEIINGFSAGTAAKQREGSRRHTQSPADRVTRRIPWSQLRSQYDYVHSARLRVALVFVTP